MLTSFTRRHKLDYKPCELRYKFVPAAFRYDLLKTVLERLHESEHGHLREYCIYRHLSVTVNKDYERLFGEDAINEFYNSDLLMGLVLTAQWHEVLSMIEALIATLRLKRSEANDLFDYHHIGYEAADQGTGAVQIEVKYDLLVEEVDRAQEAASRHPAVAALLSDARQTLVAPKEVSVENSIANSMKAIEGYLKAWLAGKGFKASTLGEAVKEIRNRRLVDTSIANALEQFYIYRNKQPNIGHGSVALSEAGHSEALLVLDMASSFINYFHRLDSDGTP